MVRTYYLMVEEERVEGQRRVDLDAETPDFAFMLARNHKNGSAIELWEDEVRLARMVRGPANTWKIEPAPDRN